jgi:hypothetical protein
MHMAPKKISKAKVFGAAGSAPFLISGKALAFAAAATEQVMFSCSSPLCHVSLQLGASVSQFVSQGSMMLPKGVHELHISVTGVKAAKFTLSVTSGATASPIVSTAPVGGTWPIRV